MTTPWLQSKHFAVPPFVIHLFVYTRKIEPEGEKKNAFASDWFAFIRWMNNGKWIRCEWWGESFQFDRSHTERAYIQAISKINEIKLNAKTLNYFLRRFISNARNFWSTIHSECLMATNIPFEQLSLPWSSEDQATTKKKKKHSPNRISANKMQKNTFRSKMPGEW